MSVKTVIGSIGAFMAHHVADLNAIGGALNSILAAVPVNAGTRDHIKEAIATVEQSAANISAFLESVSGDGEMPEVHISETDLETAVASRVSTYLSENLASIVSAAVASNMNANPPTIDGDALDAAVDAYFAAHPPVAPEGPANGEETTGKSKSK